MGTSINGETIHSAAHLNARTITTEMIQEWSDARMLIVDEISFAKRSELKKVCDNLRLLRETSLSLYGGLPCIFAGDFSQLPPVQSLPLYRYSNFGLWWDEINCFWELNGSHRFERTWGAILRRIREGRVTQDDFDIINTRVISDSTAIPADAAYAAATNKDRCAIGNGLFATHLEATHSHDTSLPPPKHTLVIRAAGLKWKSTQKQEKRLLNRQANLDSLWGKCVDCDVEANRSACTG